MGNFITNTKTNRYYSIIILLGIILITWEISIYQKTIVSLSTVLVLILIFSFLSCILEYERYKKTYRYTGIFLYFGLFLTSTLSWGLIGASGYMILNYHLASKTNISTKEFDINETSTMLGSRSSEDSDKELLVRIKYQDNDKELVFSSDYANKQEYLNYTTVELTTTNGFFYHEIILDQQLTNPINNEISDFISHWKVQDFNTKQPLNASYAIVSNHEIVDTISHQLDSISFSLDYNNKYTVSFSADGYHSKTILFNTFNVPFEEQVIGFTYLDLIVELIPSEELIRNDTVAYCVFDTEENEFIFNKK